MEQTLEEILARIDTLLSEDGNSGRRAAHDLVDRLVEKMEALVAERTELERKLYATGNDSEDRTSVVEEIAVRLEKTAGRARLTKELIDSVIERLYRLDDLQREKLMELFEENK